MAKHFVQLLSAIKNYQDFGGDHDCFYMEMPHGAFWLKHCHLLNKPST